MDIYALIAICLLVVVVGWQIYKIRVMQQNLSKSNFFLGYYQLRFGKVSPEDIRNGVGLDLKALGLKKENLVKK